ncbi:unnamed protein product [Paramecium sonneborni]|uniref:Uncharacterized protein n=1 Tax=Paramecium sonneborni TaxID=65129 RepID=A0A8S1NPM2_9CILI|nr:unnamed protein product [Paramecium sonneborni]
MDEQLLEFLATRKLIKLSNYFSKTIKQIIYAIIVQFRKNMAQIEIPRLSILMQLLKQEVQKWPPIDNLKQIVYIFKIQLQKYACICKQKQSLRKIKYDKPQTLENKNN